MHQRGRNTQGKYFENYVDNTPLIIIAKESKLCMRFTLN